MKNVLICGAGMSATDLISYMLKHAEEYNWFITVVYFDCYDDTIMERYIKDADIVISLLPPGMHAAAAKIALQYNAHVVTASYASQEMIDMHEEAREKGLTFLNELGADPGIDHMNGMRSIDKIRKKGGELLAFESYCGSLVAPESNDNPWGYKFTWSPMNVILAGSAGASYYKNGALRCRPYHKLFTNPKIIGVPGFEEFEAYENRDSVVYRKKYKLDNIPTLIRATLRYPGFCEGWNLFIQLGLTADNYQIEGSENMTYRQWVAAYLPDDGDASLENKLADTLHLERGGKLHEQLLWTELLSERPIKRVNGTPAEILLDLLLDKLKFNQDDTDMLVFYERIEYKVEGQLYEHLSYLATKGLDHWHTAISRTVGLPAAIGAKLILNGEIKSRGVLFPWTAEVYDPVLNELEELGIAYTSYDSKIERSHYE
ncbi:saccharopine dehydrogenase C-terminal domain-containing protein [uncultured Eudoraea sp.]|uniref:saccharopine dehydrogenase C-terminal domain-containing protein n=1 Tax=uncultured Eudoraea sp. TaxID=1035614 RepID=UPI00262B5B66|nr:saccharopine dehydrogenase C-terminal domain-containing protein [uncultured Eudoraea sp.]